jgi:hypothetical protein
MNTYTPERVTLELSRDEFEYLALGVTILVTEAKMRRDGYASLRARKLANAINLGNPAWTPYEVPEENP